VNNSFHQTLILPGLVFGESSFLNMIAHDFDQLPVATKVAVKMISSGSEMWNVSREDLCAVGGYSPSLLG